MFIYMVGLILVFMFNQKLNLAQDQTDSRILARSTITALGWPILLLVVLSIVVGMYICAIGDKLTDLLSDFLDEVK